MQLFRNPSVRRGAVFYAVLLAAGVCIGWQIAPACAALAAALCMAAALFAFVSARRRYARIAALSADIDSILHGAIVPLTAYEEGELAILQSELEKLTVHLREQAERLACDKAYLADSIADISHQLRTPLTSVNLIVSFLSQPDLTNERRLTLTKELAALLTRIDWLIAALLKLSLLDAGTVRFAAAPVAAAEIIRQAAEPLLIPMELRDIRWTVCCAPETRMTGVLAWTVEALGNILKNCMEHTPAGGEICVTAEENALYTSFCVEDTGSGIAKEDLPHLFERFYKGRDAGAQSVGIGLALTRKIAEAQNGTVKAENRSGGGAKFTMRFYKTVV